MKAFMLLLISGMPLTGGVVEMLPVPNVAVFGGARRAVDIVFRNQAQTNVQLAVALQIWQSSSATAAPWLEPRAWRSIALPPRQASVERAEIDFPIVREQSQFIVRFASGREVLGLVPVHVYPHNILSNLADSVGPVILSSVRLEIRRVLSDAGFALTDSSAALTGAASPQLSIHGPEFSGKELALGIGEAVSRAKSGFGVVLILPDYDERRVTAPSYYPIRLGQGTLVTVREETLADLSTDPLAQLRLVRIIRLALGQESLKPPESDL